MIHNSVQARDRIFVKGNRFLSFAKNIGKNTGRNLRSPKELKNCAIAARIKKCKSIIKKKKEA